ncbi:unnamed protein product [Clonostachys byssicola]|uniref:Uncharacterized protein n=1 Tax=Clonostachys byssicola TaxID=160290 RepID=A0A9N9UFI8_9HYPO|nr:unnamed protein product [Clonostachys byssicola]
MTRARPGPSLQFINIATPDDTASHARRRQVRSHAARNSSKRQRAVSEYQEKSRQHGSASARAILTTRSPRLSHNLSAAWTDPFDTFIRKVSRLEWFLIDHFVRHVAGVSTVCLPFTSSQEEAQFVEESGRWWTQMAAVDTGILAAVLQMSCRDLSYNYPAGYAPLALRYNAECMESVSDALKDMTVASSDLTIAKTFALASDATLCGDAQTAKIHLEGLDKLVAIRGGTDTMSALCYAGKLVTLFLKGPFQQNALVTITCIGLMASAYSEEETSPGGED